MTDRLSPQQRSENMRAVRGKDTGPEMRVRRVAHALGLRYRLHGRDLPGSPDLVLPRRRTVIFVHGCFWHRHPGCSKTTIPKTRPDFWTAKFDRNVTRDAEYEALLRRAGWRVLILWECETRDLVALATRLRNEFSLETCENLDLSSITGLIPDRRQVSRRKLRLPSS